MEKTEKEIKKKKLLFRSVPTQPVTENSKKITKRLRKLKNTVMASFQAKIGWKMLRKGENKNYISVTFLPNGLEEIPKKSKKIKKIPLWVLFKPK